MRRHTIRARLWCRGLDHANQRYVKCHPAHVQLCCKSSSLACPAAQGMAPSGGVGATAAGSQAHSRLQRVAWLLVACTAHFLAALNAVLARYLQARLLLPAAYRI